jgi:hypothetical protein
MASAIAAIRQAVSFTTLGLTDSFIRTLPTLKVDSWQRVALLLRGVITSSLLAGALFLARVRYGSGLSLQELTQPVQAGKANQLAGMRALERRPPDRYHFTVLPQA